MRRRVRLKCLEVGLSRVLELFVVYIARAHGNYRADATPARGVWSQIPSAVIYHASSHTAMPRADVCVRARARSQRLLKSLSSGTYRHVAAPRDRRLAPVAAHRFQSSCLALTARALPRAELRSSTRQDGVSHRSESGREAREG